MRREEIISDNQILGKIKSGDITCFEYLYKRYKGKIYNFVLSLSEGDFYLAEEITQNVFLRIWEIRKDMNTTESVSSFMYTVSRNMFLNTVKRRAQEALYQASLQQEYNEADNTVEAEIEYKLLEQEINRLIEQLPPARQRIYRLSKQQHFVIRRLRRCCIYQKTRLSLTCISHFVHAGRYSLSLRCQI